MAQNVKIDKYNFYDNLATNLWKLADKEQLSNNDTEFVDLNKFEKKIKDLLHITEKNLIYSNMKEKNYELIEEKIPLKDARNDSDLTFSFILDQIDFSKKEPGFLT